MLEPRHKTAPRELFQLPAEEMQAVLAHVVLMPLEEVEDEVVDLRVVRSAHRTCIVHLLRISLRRQQMILVDRLQHLQVLLVMQIAFFLLLLPLRLFLSKLTDPVFPVLGVAAEDALVEDLA